MIERDPDKGAELLRAGFEARLAELYQQWQALRISTSRFAELLGVSPWELTDLLHARGLKPTNLPG
jgi:predicted HTH domain antitoxin